MKKKATKVVVKKQRCDKVQRDLVLLELAEMMLKGRPRSEMVDVLINKHNYSINTTGDLISDAMKVAAKQFSTEEIDLAKRQIKQLSEDIMFDKEEFSMSRLKAAELLAKLMRAFQPEVAIQNNTVNNLNFKDMSLQELKELLNVKN